MERDQNFLSWVHRFRETFVSHHDLLIHTNQESASAQNHFLLSFFIPIPPLIDGVPLMLPFPY